MLNFLLGVAATLAVAVFFPETFKRGLDGFRNFVMFWKDKYDEGNDPK
jgi:hypothetical protein